MFQPLVTAALLLAPQSTAPAQEAPMFPAASNPFTFEVSDDAPGMNYHELVRAYGELTGLHFTFDEETSQLLKNQRVLLDRSVTVPAEEVTTFIESLLVQGKFCLAPLKARGTKLIRVSSLMTAARNNLRASAAFLAPDQVEIARAHPAMLFTTTISVPNLDARQVSNSLRTLITDANTHQLLPAGNANSLVIVGFGSQLMATYDTLKLIDAASAPVQRRMYEVVRLEKAKAQELADTVAELIGDASTVRGQAVPPGQPMAPYSGPRVIADARTNSVFIGGTPEEIARIKDLIVHLDS
ncbi:MAG: secretin N-terminal domain-containing protein [Planctomycetota bacterium]